MKQNRNQMEENVEVITIAELIQGARPLTGTSSLHSRPSRPITRASSSSHEPPLPPTDSNPNPNSKILTSLNYPTILVGTLTLTNSHDNCLQFSDTSSHICCDILDFSVRSIGKKIHVVAWNFIPLRRGNGFLEIIRWKFAGSSSLLTGCSGSDTFDSVPLASGSNSVGGVNNFKSRYNVHGALESISPVSVVPCSSADSFTDSTNIRGFIMRVLVCECKLCSSKESIITQGHHVFRKPVFLYFSGSTSCWHPAISRLVGNVILISGLQKKLVFIGKESQLMFVNTEHSVFQVPRLSKKCLPISKTVIRGNGECGVYTGIVKGVYMQGMVVELDSEVWLLLTDKLQTVPHSLRVGAVISVRNVHFVNPRFSWAKILILGACFKTSIIVESFSPLEVGCYKNAVSQSMLEKFMESLPFSARLWALLIVTCFRKKFSGILSEKEILGSKHKKGLAHIYTSSHLPSSVIRARHGVFMEFCKHESCGCGSEPYCGNLKLVVPISSFIHYCKATWTKTVLQLNNDNHTVCENSWFRFLSCEGRSFSWSKWRIFPSEEIGIVLLGNLKISPSSGRLQLVDMTGSIDVVIPDLLSTWNTNSIYEVVDYGLAMQEIPEMVDRLRVLDNVSFSCRSIFNFDLLPRKGNLSMFVYFHVRNASNRILPLDHCVNWTNYFKELESGTFHLIRVTHKFPFLKKFQGDPMIANRSSSVFVEAIVLPWDLVLDAKSGTRYPAKVSRDQPCSPVEYCASDEHIPVKRHKIDYTSSGALSSGLVDDLVEGEVRSIEISCSATVRSVNDHSFTSSGILCCTKARVQTCIDFQSLTAEKVLLEFNTENFCKYQVGGYYIIKHYTDDPLCNVKDSTDVSSIKVLITLRTDMWRVMFSSDIHAFKRSSHDPSQVDSSLANYEVPAINQVELPLKVSGSAVGTCSDIYLHLSGDAMDILKINLKELEEDFNKPSVSSEGTSNMSSDLYDSNCLFPEGNLVSFRGDVVAVHGFDHSSDNVLVSCKSLGDVLHLKSFQELARSFCVHILVDHQPVRVFGSLSEHKYLIGFGPGVNATFHRVLEVGGPTRLMLTPVSFIVINSIRLVNGPNIDKWSNLSDSDVNNIGSLDNVSSVLISELVQCSDCKPMCIRGRVVAVHVLILEKNNRKYDDVRSNTYSRTHHVDIPLAGFILDDGSSSCCCWANAGRAATLLRLHEELPQSALGNSSWTLKWVGVDDTAWTTTLYHLERILQKHDRVTVINYGSMADSSYQDLTVSVSSENVLNSSDENLLKFIIFNSCFGNFWRIGARVMDSSAVRQLEKELVGEMDLPTHSMQNVWASEVFYTDYIIEARNVLQELLDR